MPPRPPLTHFLCLPLHNPSTHGLLSKSLSTFIIKTANIRTSENPDGIPEGSVRPVGTLHLTLGVMSLITPERVESASSILRSLSISTLLSTSRAKEINNTASEIPAKVIEEYKPDKYIAKGLEPLTITLRGLQTTSQDPTKATVLYTPPVTSPELTLFCNSLRAPFLEAGLMIEETRPLLLHATVMNTIYVSPSRTKAASSYKRKKGKVTVDATKILAEYEDFTWIEGMRVEKVAICKMGAKKVEDKSIGEDYVQEAWIEMP